MNTQPLTCEMFDASLPDYLDDSLDPDSHAALESHAAACSRCNALLANLSALTRDARLLPDLAPSRDLWPNIAARLETPVVALPARARTPTQHPARSRFLTPAWLAAAAALLVAATASLTVLVTRPRTPTTPITTTAHTNGASGDGATPNVTPNTSRNTPPSAVASAVAAPAAPAPRMVNTSARRPAPVPVQRIYDHEIAQLDSIVHDRRSQLDSTTIVVIEKNLRIIDQAIAQSRAALAHDPNSSFLHNQLNEALDQKVALLRTVALLPTRT
ncbi:MAG TPA: zf-HC2 domain-containing protein [Gemmatimonadaceae bacterium]|jgi:anti-sigma factor RsiW